MTIPPPYRPTPEAEATAPADRAAPTFRQKVLRGEFLLLTGHEQARLGLIVLALLALVLWILFGFVEPPPPKVVRMSTGSPTGAYTRYAKEYAIEFAKQGIKLEVVTSAGSVENLKRLDDPAQRIDLAFVQGGVSGAQAHPTIESLASVAYEPIWFFYDKKRFAASAAPKRLTDLAGHSLAIDAEGSGVRAAATRLLEMNGMSAHAKLVPLGGVQAVDALLAGTLDAAMIVAAVDSPAVQKALASDLGLMSLENVDAYVRLLPWLAKVTLPRGVADIARDLPHEDVTLIAAAANLVARSDLHHAVMFLTLDVASTIHKRPAAVNAPADFPSDRNLDYVQSEESKRFFKSGRPFLQQYLPFWLANLVERMIATLVPLLAIGLPLVRLLPAFFDWRVRAKLTQLYDEVLTIESRHYGGGDRANGVTRLNQIDESLPTLGLGADHYVEVYNLKSHLDLVKSRLLAPSGTQVAVPE